MGTRGREGAAVDILHPEAQAREAGSVTRQRVPIFEGMTDCPNRPAGATITALLRNPP